MQVRPSRYNHYGKVGENRNILFNLVTSSVALFTDSELKQIIEADFQSDDLALIALQNGFVLPFMENEVEKVLSIERMNNYSTRFAGFQILPTTACNARCWYCYEEDFVKETITDECVEAIPDFIESYMDMVDDIHITWFGGEPLLGFDRMLAISNILTQGCDARNIGYSSDIITNATLLTPDIARQMVDQCRISQAQVTLDGVGIKHIERKRYCDTNITFDDIIDAMDLLVESDIRLLIRLNIDKNNTDDCLELISLLGKRWAYKENAMLYVAPLYGSNISTFYAREELNDVYGKVFPAMIDAGWIQTLDGLPMNFNNATCSARMINNYVIAPNGDVFKCEHLLSCGSEKLGTVFDGIIFNEAMTRWASPNEPQRCLDCAYLPSCHGGCYAAEAMNFGFERCPHIAFITNAIIDAAGYLLEQNERIER